MENVPKLRFPEFSEPWASNKLGEIAKFSKGKGVSKADIVENGATECIRYGELYTTYGEVIKGVYSKTNVQNENLVLSEINDVIIPSSGETQIDIATASCILKNGIALGGDLNIIKTPLNGVFLSYYLNSCKKQEIANLAQGISVVHLYASQLSNLIINYPLSTIHSNEQAKIASFLTAVDEKLQALKKKKELLETYKKGMMQQIFCLHHDSLDLHDVHDFKRENNEKNNQGNQDNHKKSRFRPLRFKQDDGSDFPNWEMKKLGEVCEITIGEFVIKTKQNPNGKYPVFNGGISPTGYYDDYNNDGNKIIVSARGANAGFVNFQKEKYWAGNSCYSICLLDSEQYSILYFYYFIKMFENRFIENQQAANIPSVSKKDAENFEIYLPSINEQTKIANFLSAIDEKIKHCQSQIEKTEQWKKGLLQQMFC